MQEMQIQSLDGEDPLEEEIATHSSILAWESHGQRSLAGYSLWGLKESDMTEHAHKVFLRSLIAAAAKSLQVCPTVCNPIDGSPPGSPVSEILQARTLEWVAISLSKNLYTYIETKLHSRANKFQCKTYHNNSPAKQEHNTEH